MDLVRRGVSTEGGKMIRFLATYEAAKYTAKYDNEALLEHMRMM